jgi:hypothetical protein
MEIRALKALLAALTASNVKRYELSPDGRVVVEFGDGIAQVQLEDADVEGIGDLQLPEGLIDPRAPLKAIYERDAKRRAAAVSTRKARAS